MRFELVGRPVADEFETHARWRASVPGAASLGPTIEAKLDFSLHRVLLPYRDYARAAINTIDAQALGFAPTCPPLVDLRENLSEKLARWRHRLVARDVFDLASLAPRVRNELPLIRELVFLKVYGDFVFTHKGARRSGAALSTATARPMRSKGKEELGTLAQPNINWSESLELLAGMFGDGIGEPRDAREKRLAACMDTDKQWYRNELDAFVAKHQA